MPEGPGDGFYFEVLVARDVASMLDLPTNVSDTLVRSMATAGSREIDRAPLAANLIVAHIAELGAEPSGISWVGETRSASGVAADIRVDLVNRPRIHYQLKSVGAGTGTVRNLGVASLQTKFRLDLQPLVREAFSKVQLAVFGLPHGPKNATSFGALRTHRTQLDGMELAEYDRLAKAAFEPFKIRMTGLLEAAFNRMSAKDRSTLVLDLLGIVTGENTFLLIHDRRGPRLLSSERLVTYLSASDLRAELQSPGNSLTIATKDTRLFRLNSSATNHQGLSDPCARLFYLPGAEELLTLYTPATMGAPPHKPAT